MSESPWLRSAADLLARPNPRPTPFLVDGLIVEGAVGVIQGPPKAAKTWAVLEIARAIVTGEPAFGRFAAGSVDGIVRARRDWDGVEVHHPGPVIVLLEESGEKALHRRLDTLARGHAQGAEAFRDLYYGANLGVQLDRPDWQTKLLQAVDEIEPAAVFLDPLVRMKGAGRDENSQLDMAPVLEFLRELRESTEPGRAVIYVHHTGHEGTRQRGSSDLEAFWESKLTIKRLSDGTRELSAEHREAEGTSTFRYRFDWNEASRSLRLVADDCELRGRVEAYLADHPDASANAVDKAVTGKRPDILALVKEIRNGVVPTPGTTPEPPRSAHLPGVVPGGGSLLENPAGTTTARAGSSGEVPPEEVERLAALFREEERRELVDAVARLREAE